MAQVIAAIDCARVAPFGYFARAIGCAAALLLILSSTASGAELFCGPAAEAPKEIAQFETSSKAQEDLRDRMLLGVRNLMEVHAKLMAVTEVKPALWICLSPRVNAFVIDREKPIFVMVGLLGRFGHEKEVLAGMLAHELGHLERDHAGYRNRAEGIFQYNANIAARSALDRTYNYSDANRIGGREYARQHFAFSREQEKDADDYGTILLSRAGFRPAAMVKALVGLLAIEGNKPTEWSDTHPGMLERLAMVEPRAYDEEIDQLARSLDGQGDRAALARQIDEWLRQLPDSGNAWYHKAVFLERLRSARAVEAYERSLSRGGPSISRTEEELAQVWLALCVGLFEAGHKAESASCSLRIKDRALRAEFRDATFGDALIVGGEEAPASDLLTAMDSDGRKIITNDPATLRARGLPTTQTIAPWRAIRFPPTATDQPLRLR